MRAAAVTLFAQSQRLHGRDYCFAKETTPGRGTPHIEELAEARVLTVETPTRLRFIGLIHLLAAHAAYLSIHRRSRQGVII